MDRKLEELEREAAKRTRFYGYLCTYWFCIVWVENKNMLKRAVAIWSWNAVSLSFEEMVLYLLLLRFPPNLLVIKLAFCLCWMIDLSVSFQPPSSSSVEIDLPRCHERLCQCGLGWMLEYALFYNWFHLHVGQWRVLKFLYSRLRFYVHPRHTMCLVSHITNTMDGVPFKGFNVEGHWNWMAVLQWLLRIENMILALI